MTSRILIATDGSKLSRKAVKHGIALARALGASVVACHARPPFPTMYYGEPMAVPESALQEYDADMKRFAAKYLAEVAADAKRAGVDCKGVHQLDTSPADCIMRTAKREKCDLIVMASHGRKGLARALIGSETNRVLTLSKVPVLVVR